MVAEQREPHQANRPPSKGQQAAWNLYGVMAFEKWVKKKNSRRFEKGDKNAPKKGDPIFPIRLAQRILASERISIYEDIVDEKGKIVSEKEKVLRSKFANLRRPLSSQTKLMTVNIVLDLAEKGEIDLDREITISERAGVVDMVALDKRFKAGDKYTVRDFVKASLLYSSNVAAIALAEHVADGSEKDFVPLMNEKARNLGLTKTTFANSTGLTAKHYREKGVEPPSKLFSSYSTVKDISRLSHELWKHKAVEQIFAGDEKIIRPRDGKVITESIARLDRPSRYVNSSWSNPAIFAYKSGMTNSSGYCYTAMAKHNALLNGKPVFSVGMGYPTITDRLGRPSKWVEKYSNGKVLAKFQADNPSKWGQLKQKAFGRLKAPNARSM